MPFYKALVNSYLEYCAEFCSPLFNKLEKPEKDYYNDQKNRFYFMKVNKDLGFLA